MKKRTIFLAAFLTLSLGQSAFAMRKVVKEVLPYLTCALPYLTCSFVPDLCLAEKQDLLKELIDAIREERNDWVEELLNHPWIEPNGALGFGDSPLQVAIDCGNHRALALILKHDNTDPNQRGDRRGREPLLLAILKKDHEALALLLKHERIDSNERLTWWGVKVMPPLFCAVYERNYEAMRLLLDHNKTERNDLCPPEPNDKCRDWRTPLHLAAERGDQEAIEMLVRDSRVNLEAGVINFGRKGCEHIEAVAEAFRVNLEAEVINSGRKGRRKKAYKNKQQLGEWKKMREEALRERKKEQALEDRKERIEYLDPNKKGCALPGMFKRVRFENGDQRDIPTILFDGE